MGYACLCIQTAGDHLFWEQGMLGKKGVRDRRSRIQAGDAEGMCMCAHPGSFSLTGGLLNSSYLAKFLRKTKRLSPPTGQASCTSTTNSWSSTPRSETKGDKAGVGRD